MKQSMCTLGIITMLVLVFGAVSDVTSAVGDGPAFRIIKGEGSVCAVGSGMIQFNGTGEVVARVDMGQLILNDEAAVVEIHGKGIKRQLANGWILYEGFHGYARLNGEDVFGQIVGKGLRMAATGEGIMLLMGRGLFKSPCDAPDTSLFPFTGDGVAVELGGYIVDTEPLPGM